MLSVCGGKWGLPSCSVWRPVGTAIRYAISVVVSKEYFHSISVWCSIGTATMLSVWRSVGTAIMLSEFGGQ